MRRRCGPPPLLQPFISRVPGSSTQLLRLLSAFRGYILLGGMVLPPGSCLSVSLGACSMWPLQVIGTPSWAVVGLCSALRLTAGVHHRTCDSLQGYITGPALYPFSPQCQQTRPFVLISFYCNGFLPRGINLPLVSTLRHYTGVLLHTGGVACSQLSNSGSSPLLP